jgi:PilZ domain
MSEDNEPGANYLAALRQSGASGAAPARAPETSHGNPAASSPQTPAAWPEKRKGPRYRCEGSARVQESGGATSTWATFTDISMHGCYIESTAPYRLGAVVDLKLEAGGRRIEAAGEVRVAYPGLGMGVSFTRMSEEDRNRLRELLKSISARPPVGAARGHSSPTTQPSPVAQSELPAVANPAATLQAIAKFFESRHMMGRDDFLRILQKNR